MLLTLHLWALSGTALPATRIPPLASLLYFRARAACVINFNNGWAVRSAFSNTARSDIFVLAAITRTRF
jgi:hypothetical protein